MTSTTAIDSSGNGNTGTLTNMTATSSATIGKIGQALNFDGVNDYVSLGSYTTEQTTYTISLWTYVSVSASGVLLHRGDSDGCFYNPSISINSNTISIKESGCSGSGDIGSKIVTNGWHHIAVTRSGQIANFYVDGVLSITDSSQPSGAASNGRSVIGAQWQQSTGYLTYMNNKIDDVRIYNRAISAKEVLALYKAGGGVIQASTANTKANTNSTGISGGLVGHWTFDGKNMTSTTATDISGSNNTGTLTNMTTTSSATIGKIGQGLSFSGTSEYINVASPVVSSYPATITAWVKSNPLGSSGYALSITDTDYWNMWSIGVGTTGVSVTTTAGGGTDSTVALAADTTQWTFVAAVLTSATSRTLYVNNISPVTDTNNRTPASLDNFNIGRIGGYWTAQGFPNYFNGKVDDVRIYNRALSPNEVQALYKAGGVATGVSPVANNSSGGIGINSGLVGYWTFDGKNMANATATDSSGSDYNGTLVNSPTRVIGKMGQGLKFNGTTQYISAPAPDTNFLGAITIAAWVKPSGVTNNIASKIVSNGATYNPFDFILDNVSGQNVFYSVRSPATVNCCDYRSHKGGSWTSGVWQHVAITYADGNVATPPLYYLNGVPQSAATVINAGTGVVAGVTAPILIGARDDTKGVSGMDGTMDDVRIYNRALSPAEVKSLYKLGSQ